MKPRTHAFRAGVKKASPSERIHKRRDQLIPGCSKLAEIGPHPVANLLNVNHRRRLDVGPRLYPALWEL